MTELHDEMVRGSIKLELPGIKKELEISWSLPPRVHFIWIGPEVIKDKYVKNINKTVRVTFEGSCAETWVPGRRRTKDGKRRGTALGPNAYARPLLRAS